MRTMAAVGKLSCCFFFAVGLLVAVQSRWCWNCSAFASSRLSSPRLSVKYRRGSSFTTCSPTHALWPSFPRTRLFPRARQGMPVSSVCTMQSYWCSGDDHADVAASFSISRLVSGVLAGRAEQTVTTRYIESFFHRQNITRHADKKIKKHCCCPDTPQTVPCSLMEPPSSSDFVHFVLLNISPQVWKIKTVIYAANVLFLE